MNKTVLRIISAMLIISLSLSVVALAASTRPTYEQRVNKSKIVLTPPDKYEDISGRENKRPERPIVYLPGDEEPEDTEDESSRYEPDIDTDYEPDYEPEDNTEVYREPEPLFSDIGTDHELYVPIAALKESGIINGYSDGTFRPYSTVTRAEICSMLIGMLKSKDSIRSRHAFTDVPSDHWADSAIGKAYTIGIINGKDISHFAPEDAVTDEQLIKLLVGILGYSKNVPYVGGGYPSAHIEIARNIGLLKNIDYRIGNETDRGTVARLIYNAFFVYNSGEYKLIELKEPEINAEKVPSKPQTTPVEKEPEYEPEEEPEEPVRIPSVDVPEIEFPDDLFPEESDTLTSVKNALPYLSTDDTEAVSDFIDDCLREGEWCTPPDEILAMVKRYPGHVFLEELSDVFNSLN